MSADYVRINDKQMAMTFDDACAMVVGLEIVVTIFASSVSSEKKSSVFLLDYHLSDIVTFSILQ